MTPPQAASFRDPHGRLFFHEDRVFRMMNAEGEASVRRLLASSRAKPFLDSGSIVPTRILGEEAGTLLAQGEITELAAGLNPSAIAEHERAPFPNYVHEWPAEMLHAAALLTIQLASSLLADGIGIKDATPSNVMFWGPKPVFLDLLSFEQRDGRDPTWLPYAQFVRTFLLPLVANRRFGIPLSQIFTTRRDGLEPEEIYPLLGRVERFRPRYLSLVSMPVWMSKRAKANTGIYQPRRLKNAEQAQYILSSLLKRQGRALRKLRPEDRTSAWSTYTEGNNNYSATQADAKARLVRDMLAGARPGTVLDVGCNTGVFSILAAEAGAKVVSIDYDPVVVGRLWKVASQKNLPILPLVVDLARPTPALGWANTECRSFLERASGAFDAVLMLALLHHLIVTERVPLPEIFALARRLTRRWLIVEYVGPGDSMFARLTRGREHLHQGLNEEIFEAAARRYFRVVRSEPIPDSARRLYLMEAE